MVVVLDEGFEVAEDAANDAEMRAEEVMEYLLKKCSAGNLYSAKLYNPPALVDVCITIVSAAA